MRKTIGLALYAVGPSLQFVSAALLVTGRPHVWLAWVGFGIVCLGFVLVAFPRRGG